ncbi:MAG: transposase [Terriglobales bacterium]
MPQTSAACLGEERPTDASSSQEWSWGVARNLRRYYGLGDLHFVTFSCYRRLPLLGSARRRNLFLRRLEKVRVRYEMVVVGYVAMPEHVHLLVSEPLQQNLSVAVKALKQGMARRVLGSSKPREQQQTELFPRENMPGRFWQARFYDFNVWSAKKRIEKLRYIHRNPVTRGLVRSPEQWRWSSFRSYAYGEPGLVRINTIIPLRGARKR